MQSIFALSLFQSFNQNLHQIGKIACLKNQLRLKYQALQTLNY
jgi:hypothetical protein